MNNIRIKKVGLGFVAIIFFIHGLSGQDYELVWSEEFDETSLNTDIWRYEVNGDGGGNNELQYYTDRAVNLEIKDGILNIIARKESYLGKEYTSARINTRGKLNFKYGRIEARMKMPYGQGIWPAFWMLGSSIESEGWPDCGEIDIMEMIGGDGKDNTIYSTLHWGPWIDGGHPNYGQSYTLPSGIFADDFHIIETEWNANYVKTYCDGTLFYTIDISGQGLEAFHDLFFIIVNLAVGGNWPGSPDGTTVFPQYFQVDYIRLYQTPDMLLVNLPSEIENENELVVYPNPFSDSVIIISHKPMDQIEILDSTGRICFADPEVNSTQHYIQTNKLSEGMYFLKVKFEGSDFETIKIIK